jgi:1-acyl-sn-glycerol-3-phosphate acyltransferase
VVFVRRGDAWSGARALRHGLRALTAGVSVLGFPEGTTTYGDTVLPFKRGLFGLARLAGVPVVPIALRYSEPEVCWVGDEWFLPHYVRTAMRPITMVDITIGQPIAPTVTRCAEDLAFLARTRLQTLLR